MSDKNAHTIYLFMLTCCMIFLCFAEGRSQSCDARFDFMVSNNPLTVTFQNRSAGNFNSSFWDFGDGTFSQEQSPPPHTYPAAGEYFVTLTLRNPNGLCDSLTRRVCLQCVFPGDANNDGIVNNKDVLYVGIGYGSIGPKRQGHAPDSLSPATAWVTSTGPANFPGGPNVHHADCDGNGIINRHDLALIDRNYGLSSGKTTVIECINVNDVPLYFEVVDSIPAGSMASINIMLGNSEIPAMDVYGIAYTINYSHALIQPGTAAVDYSASLFGTPADIVFLNKDSVAGKMATAIARIDQSNLSFSGKIGSINFVMEENLAQKTMLAEILNLSFSEVTLIKSDGTMIPVCAWQDSAVVYEKYLTSDGGVKYEKKASVYPNPANERLYFDLPHPDRYLIEVTNTLGKKMLTQNAMQGKETADISHLTNGIYFVIIRGKETTQSFKIEISR